MAHKKERVELETRIMKYRALAVRMVDDEVRKRFGMRIAELEQKLREIDE
jgi:hypothetical protein